MSVLRWRFMSFVWAVSASRLVQDRRYAMTLEALLLLVAFRNRIREPDLDSAISRFIEVVGRPIDPDDFRTALARAMAAGYIRDPVRLPAGALQCHWQLDLTSGGVSQVHAILRESGKSADELILPPQPLR
jgi:hypothetical protein